MRVRVRLFASLREAAAAELVELDLPDGATAEEAWRRLAETYPALAPRRRSLAVAVNRRYARFEEPLASGDEVVFIPPVSGGSAPEHDASLPAVRAAPAQGTSR